MEDTNTQPAVTDNGYSVEYYKSQMGILLTREKELQETQRHLQRVVTTLLSLQKISRFLKRTTDLKEGLTYALHTLATEANYERTVAILDRGSDTLEVFTQGYAKDEQDVLRGVTRQQLEDFLLELQDSKESVFLLQPAQSSIGRALLPLLQFEACLLALITDNQKVIGFIAAGYSPAQAVYFAPILKLQKDDTIWFDELAHQISSTIVNLDLVDNLRAEQARLSASINSLVLGFMIVDPTHNIIFSNKAASTVLGADHITTVRDIAGNFTGVDIVQIGEQAIAQKAPIEIKEVLYDKKILRLFFGPIIKDSKVICYIFLAEDITEAKSIERSREEFFSIASHELRTPLTAIRGNASMLLELYGEHLPDDDSKQMLSDIKSGAVRLIKIVNDFLQVSSLEQKRLSFNPKPLDLTELMQQVVAELKPAAEGKQLQLNYHSPASVTPVMADSDRVKEVAANLVSNAINYTRQGSVDVEILQKPGAVTVRVKDTGVGIPERNQSLLFRKFQQAGDMLTRDVSQSTGLGLYASKLMMEAMRGTIQLDESVPDKGSTFSFTLPSVQPE